MESATSELKALWQWDATALAQGIRTGQISSREAVTACVERLHAVNPRLNAITCDLSEQAMTLADRADAAVARTRDLAPLHGVPVTIKESTDQEGCATVNGVAAFKDAVALAHLDDKNGRRADVIVQSEDLMFRPEWDSGRDSYPSTLVPPK